MLRWYLNNKKIDLVFHSSVLKLIIIVKYIKNKIWFQLVTIKGSRKSPQKNLNVTPLRHTFITSNQYQNSYVLLALSNNIHVEFEACLRTVLIIFFLYFRSIRM